MIKSLYIKALFLMGIFMLSEPTTSRASTEVDWEAEDTEELIIKVRSGIDGFDFSDAEWEDFSFQGKAGIEAVKSFLLAGTLFEDWRKMPCGQCETNIFSLLGRAYRDSFLGCDPGLAAKYFIYGALLEIQVGASTGTAIALSYLGMFNIPRGLSIENPDDTIKSAIEELAGKFSTTVP